jgi:hypothetical protein
MQWAWTGFESFQEVCYSQTPNLRRCLWGCAESVILKYFRKRVILKPPFLKNGCVSGQGLNHLEKCLIFKPSIFEKCSESGQDLNHLKKCVILKPPILEDVCEDVQKVVIWIISKNLFFSKPHPLKTSVGMGIWATWSILKGLWFSNL